VNYSLTGAKEKRLVWTFAEHFVSKRQKNLLLPLKNRQSWQEEGQKVSVFRLLPPLSSGMILALLVIRQEEKKRPTDFFNPANGKPFERMGRKATGLRSEHSE
jgi:hypothetical protein